MKPITSFTPANLDILRDDIKAALEAVAKKHGLVAARGLNIKYTAETFKTTIEFGVSSVGENAEIMVDPKLFNNMKKHGFKVGFSISDIGKTVDFGTGNVGKAKIVGMCGYTKIAVQSKDGSIYRCDPHSVKRLMAAN